MKISEAEFVVKLNQANIYSSIVENEMLEYLNGFKRGLRSNFHNIDYHHDYLEAKDSVYAQGYRDAYSGLDLDLTKFNEEEHD